MKKKKIVSYIRKQMEAKKITSKDLARALGVPKVQIELYLKGLFLPSIYDLELIAFKLGISLNELLAGEKEIRSDDDMVYFYALEARKRNFFRIIFYVILLIVAILV